MGMTLDPQFTTGRPYMYVVYTYDAAIGETAPRWNDNCPDPPGAERDGCVVSGRLSKILPDGSEQPLIRDEWCQQYASHSLGDLKFGPDGALYVTAGDGASYTFADYGQDGSPLNPCGDPPGGVGGAMTPPTAEGGSLRSQDLRTSGDPTGLDGAMLRIDPDTGAPLPDNPGTGDLNARRIVAYGLRNPFRFAFRPGTTDAYVGDVGWLAVGGAQPRSRTRPRRYATTAGRATRARGPPGRLRGGRPQRLQQPLQRRHVVPPLYTYDHDAKVATEYCPVGDLVDLGRDVLRRRHVPAGVPRRDVLRRLLARLHLGDVPRRRRHAEPATRQVFVDGASTPVDLEMGPGGDLYYADVGGGRSAGSAPSTPTRRRPRRSRRRRRRGGPPLQVAVRRHRLDRPQRRHAAVRVGPRRRRRVRRLHVRDAEPHVHDRKGRSPSVCASPTPAGWPTRTETELTVGTPPTATITAPDRRARRYAVGETVVVLGLGDARRRHPRSADVAAAVDGGPQPLLGDRARRAATSTTSRTSSASRPARSPTPTTSTRRTSRSA